MGTSTCPCYLFEESRALAFDCDEFSVSAEHHALPVLPSHGCAVALPGRRSISAVLAGCDFPLVQTICGCAEKHVLALMSRVTKQPVRTLLCRAPLQANLLLICLEGFKCHKCHCDVGRNPAQSTHGLSQLQYACHSLNAGLRDIHRQL